MAKFIFQLEGVLTQRQNIERERQRAMADLQSQLAALDLDLRKLDQSVQQSNLDVRLNHLTGPLDMAFLTAHRRFLNATQRQAIMIAQKMAGIQQKIVEKLREKQFERWKAESQRKEMLAADEAATQFSFARAGEEEMHSEINLSHEDARVMA
jgi:flagellar biosynthesis chaperone FliJ